MVKLYEHQLKALDDLHDGCILCGGVGSGKSITAIAYYYIQQGGSYDFLKNGKYVYLKNPQKLYIITTARKRDTFEWTDEVSPFLIEPIIDSWNNIHKYTDVKNAFFIFDEQRVVGKGLWVKSFLKIAAYNNWILLSATPGDTWSDYIPVFLANGFYKNRTAFNEEHVIWKRGAANYWIVDRYINVARLIRLRSRVLVDMDFIRQTVRHDNVITVDYDKDTYKWVVRNRRNPETGLPIETASEFCQQLRKIVNSDKTRIDAILDIFHKHSKIIIFYNYDYELNILKNIDFGEDAIVAEWNGHKHQEIPNSDKWIYLVQYVAGAEGWNCIQTDSIIFYSQTYSYKVLEQARGRIDRINTPFTDLHYYHLRSKAPIDLAIARALNNKKKFQEIRYFKNYI